MKMAGVADPTDTVELRTVSTLKESPQPGIKMGVLKNHKQIRMMNRTKTCASCKFIDPREPYFSLITFIARSSCSLPFFTLPPGYQLCSSCSQSQARTVLTSITGIAKAIQDAKVSPVP